MSQYQPLLVGLVSLLMWSCSIAGPVEEKWGVPLEGPFGLKEYVVSILATKNQPDLEKQKLKVAKPTLGESAGTLYRCLLLRKGRKIQPILEKLAAMKSTECTQRFGQDSTICLPEKEYRASLKAHAEKISTLTKTGETIPSCTTAGWSSM